MAGEQEKELFLYRCEGILGDGRMVTVVVVGESDDRALTFAENSIERHTVVPPNIRELTILEKKLLGRQGVGYVIETTIS